MQKAMKSSSHALIQFYRCKSCLLAVVFRINALVVQPALWRRVVWESGNVIAVSRVCAVHKGYKDEGRPECSQVSH